MAPGGQGGSLLFCFENNVNGSIRVDLDPLRPNLLGLAQGARDIGLFYSRRGGHARQCTVTGERLPKGMKLRPIGGRDT
jgi:hypothetical protein